MPFEVAKDFWHAIATAKPLPTYFVMFGWSCQPRGYQEGLYVLQEGPLSAMWANVRHPQAQAGYP